MVITDKPPRTRRKKPKLLLVFKSDVPWRGRGPDEPFLAGYVRVSTDDQSNQRQVDELVKAGVSPIDIWGDKGSGATMERPGWEDCQQNLQPGDTLVLYSLDRLSRDLIHTMQTLQGLNDRGIRVKVLTMDFDSRTPMGRFVFSMMAAFAQFERETILERSKHGLQKAREAGRIGGRAAIYTPEAVKEAYDNAGSIAAAAKQLGCSEITIKRGLKNWRDEHG